MPRTRGGVARVRGEGKPAARDFGESPRRRINRRGANAGMTAHVIEASNACNQSRQKPVERPPNRRDVVGAQRRFGRPKPANRPILPKTRPISMEPCDLSDVGSDAGGTAMA